MTNPSCEDCNSHTTVDDDKRIDCLALERPTMDPATCPKFEPIAEHKTICDACGLEIEDNQKDVGHDCNLHEWCIAVEEIPREQLEQLYIDKIIECARLRDEIQDLKPHPIEQAIKLHKNGSTAAALALMLKTYGKEGQAIFNHELDLLKKHPERHL